MNRYIICLVLVFVSFAAHAYREELAEARELTQLGAHDQAIEYYERALASPRLKGRKRERAVTELSSVKRQAGQGRYELGQRRLAEGELIGAIAAFQMAASYNPDQTTFANALQAAKNKLSLLVAEVNEITDTTQRDGDWARGAQKLDAYGQYELTVPAVREAKRRLRQGAAEEFQHQSDDAFDQGQYGQAAHLQSKAGEFDPTLTGRAQALGQVETAETAWRQRNASGAWEAADRAFALDPNNSKIKEYRENLRRRWGGFVYNEAIAAQTQGNLSLAKAHADELRNRLPNFPGIQALGSELSGDLASEYYTRAQSLLSEDAQANLGLALAYMLIVEEQDRGSVYPGLADEIRTLKSKLSEQLEFRLSLTINNSAEAAGVVGVVRDRILDTLRNSPALRTVRVLDRDTLDDILREQGLGQAFFEETTAVEVKKIRGLQAGLYVDVVKLQTVESGRNTPSYDSVEYEAGTRFVPNPRYSQLQQQIGIAREDILRAQREANRSDAEYNRTLQNTQNQPSSSSNGVLRGLGALRSALGNASVTQAENRLNNLQNELSYETAQIEEPLFQDWRYPIYDLTLEGEAILSYKVVNFTTSDIGDVRTVTSKSSIRDTYIEGDTAKGVHPDPDELPTPQSFQNSLLDQTIMKLVTALEQQLGSGASRYVEAAQRAVQRNQNQVAIENYVRYLYAAASLNSSAAREADDFIYAQIGLRMIRR